MVSSKKIGVLAKIDPNTNEAYKELYCLDTLGNGVLAKPLVILKNFEYKRQRRSNFFLTRSKYCILLQK